MSRQKIIDIVAGKNGFTGYDKKWWNPYIYRVNMAEGMKQDYLLLSMENEPKGILGNNTEFWIKELEWYAIDHDYVAEKKPETLKENEQLKLF